MLSMDVGYVSAPAVFTLPNENGCKADCHQVANKQQSECSSSSYSSYNSNSTDNTRESVDSITSTSSHIDAPPGPFSALDLSSDGRILCFDEKRNQIVSINIRTRERDHFVVPLEFQFQHYYWSHIVAINELIVLAVLKKHKSRHFYLVTFKLLGEKTAAVEISRVKTKIRSGGYQVSCQRSENCLYLGFCDRVRTGKGEISKSSSDVKLFEEQLNAHKRNYSSDSGVGFGTCSSSGDVEIDLESIIDQDDDYRTQSALLKVKCSEYGQIETEIYAIGRERLELSFSPPKFDVDQLLTKGFSSGIGTKYMTTLPSPSLSDPFYYEGGAFFIDRANPKQAFAIEAFPNPERGLFAAVQARLRVSPSPEPRCPLRRVSIDCSMGSPPTERSVWSSVEAGPHNAFVCVQDTESLLCSLWKLELEEEIETDGPSTPRHFEVPDQMVEVHSSVDGEDQRRPSPVASESPSVQHRTLIRIDSDGNASWRLVEHEPPMRSPSQNSQLSSIERCADNSITGKGTLRWIKVCDDLRLPNFRLVDNMALRVDTQRKFVCVRGIQTETSNDKPTHCFVSFPITVAADCFCPSPTA